MRPRILILLFGLLSLALVSPAAAQEPLSDCTIGVYGNPEGTVNTWASYPGGPEFTLYVVLFVEGVVNAVAYDLLVPLLNEDIFIVGEQFGEGGRGLNIMNSGGYNIGLGECAVGFLNYPVLVASHTFILPFGFFQERTITLGPNMTAGPEAPMFSTCNGQIFPCTITQGLFLQAVATESETFSKVKSLYGSR